MKKADKTSINELAQLMAEKTGQSQSVIDNFLKQLFDTIENGLQTDAVVKINNFGSFKLQWNAPRKSVDVNTGEDILIEGYNKVVFQPETFLKEKINEPFAHLETVILDEDRLPEQQKKEDIPLQKLDRQAEEIKDILADIQELDAGQQTEPNAPSTAETQEQDTPDTDTPNTDNVSSEQQPEIIHASDTETVDTDLYKTETTQTTYTNYDITKTNYMQTQPTIEELGVKKPAKSGRGWKIFGLIIIVIICLSVVLYFVFQKQIESWVENYLNKISQTEIVAEPESEPELAPVVTPEPVSIFDRPRIYTEFITTERLTYGSRLAWLSTKYYGSPYFWVYIYEANKDYIPDPNHVQIGTPVKVPKLDPALIDADNPQCLEYARKLHEQYVK